MPFKSLPRTNPSLLGLFALLAAGAIGLHAQALPPGGMAPPSFTPPPPPSFVPPPPPSSAPDSAAQPETDEETAARPESQVPDLNYPAQGIMDPDDPKLDDIVGLIQIPELGTNDVLSMLEEFTGKPILRQQSLPAIKVTFFSQGELTRGQAIRAIESLLALNGVAITRVGKNFLKAVPAAIINTQVPLFWEGTTLNARPTQLIYEKMFELDFLTPTEVIGLIQPLMSQGAPIAFEKSGKLLITDSLINLQRIERILNTVDSPSPIDTEILVFQLENSNAQDLLRRLQQIQAGPLRSRLENNTTFDADETSGQLIVFTHPSNVELIENLVAKMDVDVAPATATKVYNIRYAEAVEIVEIIDQVVSGQKEARDEQNGNRRARTVQQQQQRNEAAAAARAEASNLQFSDFLTLVPDERANSVVASGTPNDLRALDDLIDQLDVLLAQVRIEAVIVEVSLTENDTSGISALGASYFYDDDDGETLGINPFSIGGLSFGGAPTAGGPNTGDEEGGGPGIYFSPDGQFGIAAVLQAVETNSRAQVLSAPTIVTTHNREARILVGESRPILTGTSTSNQTGFATAQVQYRDIGIELTVTPLIGSNDVIQLEIEQKIENVGEPVEIEGNLQPVIISRQASSFVSVGDGQLVVLGGLQSVNTTENESKFPVLGDIPILDEIFTRTTKQEIRKEIILFLRPKIIRSAEEADEVTREQFNVMESRDRVENYLETGTFRQEEPDEEDEEPVEEEEDDTSKPNTSSRNKRP